MSNTLPQMRVNLRNLSSNNQSLQDIIKSCILATEVISVEPYDGKIHNTKMVIQIDKGSLLPAQERYIERVQFYNRLDIAEVLDGAVYDTGDEGGITSIIASLNNQGFDFTTDDVEIVGSILKAKIYSLGYFNKPVIIN